MNNLVHAVCEEEKVELLEKLDGVRSERDDARRQLATAREYSATLRGQLERAEIRLQQNEQRIAALEAENARLGKEIMEQGYLPQWEIAYKKAYDDFVSNIAIARRAAAARLRAVKRMKRVARHYQLLALRLAVGAELAGAAEAAQRDAARAAGRGG